jgi:hypothetical protein
MSQVLGAFGLLDFTMLRPVIGCRAFLNLWTVYFFNFLIFFSCRGKPRILNRCIRGARLYLDCLRTFTTRDLLHGVGAQTVVSPIQYFPSSSLDLSSPPLSPPSAHPLHPAEHSHRHSLSLSNFCSCCKIGSDSFVGRTPFNHTSEGTDHCDSVGYPPGQVSLFGIQMWNPVRRKWCVIQMFLQLEIREQNISVLFCDGPATCFGPYTPFLVS